MKIVKPLFVTLTLLTLGSCLTPAAKDAITKPEQYPNIPADQPLVVNHMIGPDQLVIRSEPKFAGAISSLTFRGQEYVNSADHGRLMQGAIAYNGRLECLNPTQAGGSRDRENRGGRSTSQRLAAYVSPNSFFEVTTRMAFWLRPGMKCTTPEQGRVLVDNKTRLSDDTYKINQQFGLNGRPNVVSMTISYDIKATYQSAVVEALTIYSPLAFDTFHAVDLATGTLILEPTLTPDERVEPLILSTADGAHAIAFVSLMPGATYARFRFPDTNKISLVYRERDGITGLNHYSAAWVIGTRDEVAVEVKTLVAKR
jgi:hypothetical protein